MTGGALTHTRVTTMDENDAHERAEEWIRTVYLPKQFGQPFKEKSLPLQSRGAAKFAAVSEDGEIVAAVCTHRAYNRRHKLDDEVLLKVRSDALKILWLENTPAKRLMFFTDPDMIRVIKEEKKKDHFPKELEIVRVKLPAALEAALQLSWEARYPGTDTAVPPGKEPAPGSDA